MLRTNFLPGVNYAFASNTKLQTGHPKEQTQQTAGRQPGRPLVKYDRQPGRTNAQLNYLTDLKIYDHVHLYHTQCLRPTPLPKDVLYAETALRETILPTPPTFESVSTPILEREAVLRIRPPTKKTAAKSPDSDLHSIDHYFIVGLYC
ncbi:MAG: hypothetical protein R2824_09725 [Saprospiraceae bacterium]|nr:hypothetical protein [Lewinella sp.]